MKTEQKNSQMLTIAEAAKRLGVSEGQVRRHCYQTPDFPAIDVSVATEGAKRRIPTWRIDAGALEEWIKHRHDSRARRISSADAASLELKKQLWREAPQPTSRRSS